MILLLRSPEFSSFLKRCLDKNVDNRWNATQLLQVASPSNVCLSAPESLLHYYVLRRACARPLESTDNPSYPPHLPLRASDDICVPLCCPGQNCVSWQGAPLALLRYRLTSAAAQAVFFHWLCIDAVRVRAT